MNQIHDLLKLKRYEQPREGYMDDFVKEFHQRQRELSRNPQRSSSALVTWFSYWFRELHAAKWAYGMGLGYFCFMSWLLLSPSADDTVRGNSATPVSYPAPTPAAPSPLKPLKQGPEKSAEIIPRALPSEPF
jgi:hypothetical protein